ncbi:MAG: hypothetical protein JRG85_13495 [Deltaproteobacteria bacterium]|nr:hypothetical protein [Deltaproteobacteria bacterium]
MSRLTPLDRVLVLILVPIWVVCFALGVRTQVRGGGYTVGLGLSVEDADHYPELTGEFSRLLHRSDPLAEAGLRAGDRLVRLGDTDLRGVGTLGLVTRTVDETRGDLSVPLVFERDGERFETALAVPPVFFIRPIVATSFALALSALFLLLRGRPTPTVRAYFYLAICWAIPNANFAGSGRELYAWYGTFIAAGFVMIPLAFRFAFRFPDDRVPEGRWHRIWPWFFAAQGVFAPFLFSRWMKIGETLWMAVVALGVATILAVSTQKYRSSGQVARRQMKWVVFGTYCAVVPMAIAAGVSVFDPGLGWLFFASFWIVPLLPLSLVISVLRFNLFDIDRLLSAAASYNVLAVVLGAGALIVVPRIAEAASGLVGIDPGTGQVALSLMLAAVAIPAHQRLRPQIDRVFFKERYALDHGIAELLPTVPT